MVDGREGPARRGSDAAGNVAVGRPGVDDGTDGGKARAFCNATPNCFPWNWNEAFQDGTNANGEPRAGYSNDGTHFSMPGGEAVGLHLVTFLDALGLLPSAQPRTTSPDDKYDAANNPLGSLLTDGMMLGTTGMFGTGASGVAATGFLTQRSTGTGSVVASKEARADGRGMNTVLTITPGGAAADETYIMQQGNITRPGAGA